MGRRIWTTIAIALLTLAAIEGLVRLVTRGLPPSGEWHYEGVEHYVEAMDVLQDAEITSDVIIAGTSLAHRIRAVAIERDLESIAYAHDLTLYNAHTPVQRRWLLEEVVPRLHPDRLIWGLASLDFNGGRPTKEIDLYEQSRAGKAGITGAIDRWLSRVLATSRYRQQIRNLDAIEHLIDPLPPVPNPSLEDIESLLERPEIVDRDRTEVALANLRGLELNDFHIGKREAEDFRNTIRDLQRRGIEVVVVLMPVPTPYIEVNDAGRTAHREWAEWMVNEASRLGVTILDYSTRISDEYFGDYIHLDPAGADLLTGMIVEDLRAMGW